MVSLYWILSDVCVCFSSEEIIYVGTQAEEFNRIDFYKSVNQYGLDSVIMIFT